MTDTTTDGVVRDRIKELRRVKASELVPNSDNWRTHPPAQRSALQAILREVGFADALLARETPEGLVLIDGHLRLEESAPDAELPVLILDVDEREAGVLLATLDPLAAMAGRNVEAQRALTEKLEVKDGAVAQLLEQLARPAHPRRTVDPDDVPEQTEAITKTGDVWKLGAHRVLCGDAFDTVAIDSLFASQEEERPAGMVLTDPPYAIYGSSTGVSSEISDDRMVRPFFEQMFRTIHARADWFAHVYVHCDWRSWAAIWEGARRGRLTPKNLLVWDKISAGLGASYANTHEFIGFFAKLPDQGAVMTAKRGEQRQVHRPNLLKYDRVRGEDRMHNAAKPVALLEELIANSSDPGDSVLDLFAGSGSTLIAAEKQGRACLAVDSEPKWVDTIVARWERLTDQKAERIPAETEALPRK